jgi:hypothetical protein
VVHLTPLYINSEVVIPAKAGIQLRKTGFRVQPGMTSEEKQFMTRYTSLKGGISITCNINKNPEKPPCHQKED